MRLFAASFASLTLLASTVLCGLQNPSSDALQALADLTRPDSEKHLPKGYRPKPATYDGGKEAGVAWRVQDTGSPIVSLINGLQNSAPFDILAVDSTADDTVTAQSANKVKQLTESTFSPINPPSIPLAVRGPYLSAWLPSGSLSSTTPPNTVGNGGYLYGQYPAFWTSSYGADGGYRLGWSGFIRINGTSYQWMGNSFGTIVKAGPNATQLSMNYTSTRSMFAFQAAGVKFNVTFMTPVTPDDYLRQSLPLSYMHFQLDPKTSKGKDIQIYTEIDERWITAHEYDFQNYPYNMQFVNTNGTSMYLLQRNSPQIYTEFRQRAEWGTVAYAVKNTAGLTSRNNNNVVAQSEFLNNGSLTFDHGPVGGPDNSFAFAINFTNPDAGNEAVFSIGHLRNPYINMITAVPGTSGPSTHQQDRYGYWQTQFPNFNDAVSFFVNDFDTALASSQALDKRIRQDSMDAVGGGTVGEHYSAITELSVRQALATIEITVSKDGTGAYNKSDTEIFLKEISSNGDMSTVDVIMPLFPLLSYLNPNLLLDLLKPHFKYVESGIYPNKWAPHDFGTYPNGYGYPNGNDEPMQVEESGNMILMIHHWAQLVGNKKAKPFLKAHYKTLQQWASFLISDSLVPAAQLSTDDFAGVLANQSNLAVKGIAGISSMGYISNILGQTSDAKNYRNISLSYAQLFAGYAISKNGTHVKLAYQNDSSWGTLYNLFFDRLLDLQLFPKKIYTIIDAWYPQVVEKYGVPLDSRHKWAKSDWMMFQAATSASNATRKLFINRLYKFVSDGFTDSPLTDLYETTTGDTPKQPDDPLIHFLARPVVGGHFAAVALAVANKANGIDANHPYQYGPPINNTAVSPAAVSSALKGGYTDPASTQPSTAAATAPARAALHTGKKQLAFEVKRKYS